MTTIIVQSTQASTPQTITTVEPMYYDAESFADALKDAGVQISGMSISCQDLNDVEEVYDVRTSEGVWQDGITISDGGAYLVSLNPKSTSNG